jgi:hypothetical protein
MSGLLDAAETAARMASCQCSVPCGHAARPVVEAVIKGIEDEFTGSAYSYPHEVIPWLRAEIAPPKPTPEGVVRERMYDSGDWEYDAPYVAFIVATLRDAKMLKEDTP